MTVHIPPLAFGTGTVWFSRDDNRGGDDTANLNDDLVNSLAAALDVGFRHVDCAEVYNTEREVQAAIAKAHVDLDRDELFITTKVMPDNANDPESSLRTSLELLRLDYVDLFLLHAPFGIKDLKATWSLMEGLVAKGLTKSIGVSNFRISDLKCLLSDCKIRPAINQIEFNPYLQQHDLVSYLRDERILLSAYAPLTPLHHEQGGPVDSIINDLAIKHNKSPMQILLLWILQQGHLVVTTSSKREHMGEALSLIRDDNQFVLSNADIVRIAKAGQEKQVRRYWKDSYDI
jgi:diketogulonate reductase-like aldo/keto reductase